MQWAKSGQLADDALLHACLCDLRFDTQCEHPRGDWLWRLIQAADAIDRLRVPILHALYQLSDERSAEQLCELAFNYAAIGDTAFRTRLYEIVEQRPFGDDACLGEAEIIKLDGEKAFLFAARVRGNQLSDREWDWHDANLIHSASEQLREERVTALLEHTAVPSIRLFHEGWRTERRTAGKPDPTAHRANMRAMSASDITAAARSSKSSFRLFRSWGVHADADLELIVRDLIASDDPVVIANLLKVFSVRALPHFDVRLLELCRHSDAEVSRLAFLALERVEHPLVRDLALTEIRKTPLNRLAVGLFISNFQPGDEQPPAGCNRIAAGRRRPSLAVNGPQQGAREEL